MKTPDVFDGVPIDPDTLCRAYTVPRGAEQVQVEDAEHTEPQRVFYTAARLTADHDFDGMLGAGPGHVQVDTAIEVPAAWAVVADDDPEKVRPIAAAYFRDHWTVV